MVKNLNYYEALKYGFLTQEEYERLREEIEIKDDHIKSEDLFLTEKE